MADKQATDKRISRKVDKKARGHQDGANNTDPLELLLEKGKETKTLTQSDVLAGPARPRWWDGGGPTQRGHLPESLGQLKPPCMPAHERAP